MAAEGKPQIEVDDQEETVLSTHARARQLEEAVREAKSQIAAKSSHRRRGWSISIAAIVSIIVVAILALK